jgi:hypothetical protein
MTRPTRSIRYVVVGFSFVVYLGLLLIPEWRPGIMATAPYFLYLLTLPITFVALLIVACWGTVGLLLARRRHSAAQPNHRAMLIASAAGLLLFAVVYALSGGIRGPLPAGSHLLKFDSVRWRQAASSESPHGDISVRQKMLGDVVSHVLPGHGRQELEQLLGPSLDTAYFADSGRDLIYLLGRERGSLFAIDSEWLLIWLDERGRVKGYQIRTD